MMNEIAKKRAELAKLESEAKKSFYVEFGKRVKHWRVVRGLRQEDLAHLMDLSRTSITNIECGKQKVVLHDAVLLAETLKVSLNKLVS